MFKYFKTIKMEYILIASSILCGFFLTVYIVGYNDLKQKHELLQKDYEILKLKSTQQGKEDTEQFSITVKKQMLREHGWYQLTTNYYVHKKNPYMNFTFNEAFEILQSELKK